jgi:transglutaminase-like putative cysteine protease
MTASPDDAVEAPHPLQGEWRPARPYRWGGHVSPQFLLVLLVVHAVTLGWFCSSWDRVRLMLYDFSQVDTEEFTAHSPESLAQLWPYAEDPVEDLTAFKIIAEPIVAGVPDAGDRARRLADYIYGLRAPADEGFDEDVRFGPAFLLARMQEGLHGNCGQMSTLLATFWRSLGGHSRAVRWGRQNGEVGHYAMELWDPERQRWFYYDMNLNGYGVDDDGKTPLSAASLRTSLITGEDLHLVSNLNAQDFTQADLVDMVRGFPGEWYVLNNTYLDWSRARRFGPLNRFYSTLAGLPHPLDRIIDNLTGARDRRLMVRGRLLIEDMFTIRGARLFVTYLLLMIAVTGLTLARTASWRRAQTPAPTAPDTHP